MFTAYSNTFEDNSSNIKKERNQTRKKKLHKIIESIQMGFSLSSDRANE